MAHCMTRPSVEVQTSASPRSGPREKPWNLQLGCRAFDVAHCVTRPSVEVETSASPRSGPRVTQRTRHAGSSCPPLPLPADITGAAWMQLHV